MSYPSKVDLRSQIKKMAGEIGFDLAGISPWSDLRGENEFFEDWIERGCYGTMKYFETFEKRQKRFLEQIPDAKSVIVLGVHYGSIEQKEEEHGDLFQPRGWVVHYARGQDYHEVIQRRLQSFVDRLREIAGPSLRAVPCVDTQPIFEKRAAVRAGLGVLGKNTMLLNPTFGPWLFLAEIVTNLDLDSDHRMENFGCGECRLCREACPTGAFDKDYQMDARLCIAYLTIEHKGVIPRELRSKIGNRVFGCNDCLQVCPHPKEKSEASWKEFDPSSGKGKWLDFEELFKLSSNREFEGFFSGTAFVHTNRVQLMRNACVVLGNSKSPEAIPFLEKALNDKSSLVKIHAVWALGQIDGEESREILEVKKQNEKDPIVLEEIRSALS